MNCWKCGRVISETKIQIGFRAVCQHCGNDLHVCVNCRYYEKGKPNECAVPGTESIRDREANNFCEEFRPKIDSSPSSSQNSSSKSKFDSLFKKESG